MSAQPIAASAMAARMPPCTVPIGFPCAPLASSSTRASPGANDASRMPSSVAAGGGATSPRSNASMPSSILAIVHPSWSLCPAVGIRRGARAPHTMRRRASASTEPSSPSEAGRPRGPSRLRISPGRGGQGVTISSMRQRGFGFIEIIIVVAIVAVAGFLLMQYFSSTAKTVEKLQQDRPLARTRLVADQATLTSVQSLVAAYRAEKGQNPPDKTAVLGLLVSPPKFQCPGNDFDYEPATGALNLTITDDARC